MTDEEAPRLSETRDLKGVDSQVKDSAPMCSLCGWKLSKRLPQGPCFKCHNTEFMAALKSLAPQDSTTPQPSRVSVTTATPPVSGMSFTTESEFVVTPKTTTNTAEPYQDFWESREVLAHIRDYARASRVGPWSLLGACLTRVAVAIPPTIQLPDWRGSYGSLNLFVALVAHSGGGKGASVAASQDAINLNLEDPIHMVNIGSGEGIAKQFGRWDRKEGKVVQFRTAALLEAQEIDTLTALSARSSSTLLTELRKAYSGETLGFGYADQEKAITIQRHTYRIGLLAQVQPGRGEALMEDVAGGTPQRFLWLPAMDPYAPRIKPEKPLQWQWKTPFWEMDAFMGGSRVIIACDPIIGREVDEVSFAGVRGELGNSLDAHSTFTRAKAAALLAILDQRANITEEDWQLSKILMEISNETRSSIQSHLTRERHQKEEAQATRKGTLNALEKEQENATQVNKMAERVWKKFIDMGGSTTVNGLKQSYNSRYRELAEDAISLLINQGRLEVTTEVDSAGNTVKKLSIPNRGKK